MPHNKGLFNLLWHSVKDQIVQPGRQEIQFRELQCPYKQCKLEPAGSCEILPIPALVLIQPAPAIQPARAIARPQWAMAGSAGSSVAPAHVH